ENAGVATVTATLSAVSGQDVTVNLGFTGTATYPDDYTRSGSSIVIPAGQASGSITLTGVQDTIQEPDETIEVDILSVTNGIENGTQQVTATITDQSSSTVQIVDDGNAGWAAVSGSWPTSTLGGYQGDSRYNTAGNGSDSATWTFTVTPGQYRVSATWPPAANRASNSPFTVLDGSTSLGTTALNQQQAPNDFNSDGASWKDIGNFSITSSTLVVKLTDAANGIVGADAVRIERQTTPVQTVDDGNAGCHAVSGTWPTSTLGGFQGDSRYHDAGTGANVATWPFTVNPGRYRISATWPAAANRASNSPFTVLDGTTPLGTQALNQRQAPNDFSDNGANWEDI